MANTCAWLTPIGSLPSKFEAAIAKQAEIADRTGGEAMCRHFGGRARRLSVDLADIAQADLVLVKGMKVRFKIYQVEKGIEARAVTLY